MRPADNTEDASREVSVPAITVHVPEINTTLVESDGPHEALLTDGATQQHLSSNLTPVAGEYAGRDRAMSGSTVAPSRSQLEIPSEKQRRSSSVSSLFSIKEKDNALEPDPGCEADFRVENNPFSFSPGQLNKLFNPKSLPALMALGGLSGLAKGIHADIVTGLSMGPTNHNDRDGPKEAAPGSSPDAAERIRVFKGNVLPEKKPTPLWKLVWIAYNDKILILLTAAAMISLALGLYETFEAHKPGEGMSVDWVEGCAICVAIVIVVMVGSLNDYQKERAFAKLNAKKEDREVTVTRSGKAVRISVHDLLVGDILHLEPGDLVAVDAVFIEGHNVKCDESSATGESDQLKKTGAERVVSLIEHGHTQLRDLDPFIISGSKVLEGVGTCLVTSVGVNASYGKILMAMRQDMEATPLQKKLDGLATAIAKLGSAAAILLFFVLLFRFLGSLSGNHMSSTERASEFTDILIVAITVIVVAVPEGLPLAVTLALAYATTRMVKLNNLVRVLKSCETMGNATTVCSDKTGTLTQNRMTVVTGTFGADAFDDKNQTGDERRSTAFARDIAPEYRRMLIESVAVNSTAFEGEENGALGFVGSKTETALLGFARDVLGMGSLAEERANVKLVQLMPFDSGRKCMGAVIQLPDGRYRFLVKGAAEILLGYSTRLCTPSGDVGDLDDSQRSRLDDVILDYARQSLRTISLVFRDFPTWPPVEAVSEEDPNGATISLLLENMALIGIVGIQDPIRPGVPEAVAKCQHAGVTVRMVTGDNMVTAKAIATDCGIYSGGVVMEGPQFRALSDEQFMEVLPHLQVLARSSPEDKKILVTRLRDMGEIVAVTGDGTNDGPALKAANIGFSMGISGTEVAKEASAIVLMDDNFASILTALMWGRAVNDAVRKFLQFQVTVNITAVLLTFISSVSDPEMRSVLTAVQLLWINLIMDSLAALALATDPPTEEILDRPPAKGGAPLISTTMWKMIIGQSIFQLTVTLTLHFGHHLLPYPDAERRSIIFNTFVWMQIFNEFNNRRLDNQFNIFTGLHRNWFFIGITCLMVGGQIIIAYFGGAAFSIVPIYGEQWAICVLVAAISWPWAIAVRFFPDVWFAAVVRTVGKPVVPVYQWLGRGVNTVVRGVKRLFRR
ncbi:cation-transporting atpase [Aspergillus campestris IBT 28561]|uniref:Calcium-transporting ATPase n=1 Tax=Aspergillus campestris (strain IBT 28561) TaxID=1392248 RepID=A0A2I1CXL4_ASPC2|nr:cation-transporting atpase [Aspergillus campestris IBT 28561]PKY02369.1 cation-transporting atpase [Aspergillus campestris IBT 28561]